MRRFSKGSLLLAPVLMASAAGCVSAPSWVSKGNSDPDMLANHRAARMTEVAAMYEQQGKPEEAFRVYQHLLAQHHEVTFAQQRMEALAAQGIGPAQTSPTKSRALMAKAAPSVAKPAAPQSPAPQPSSPTETAQVQTAAAEKSATATDASQQLANHAAPEQQPAEKALAKATTAPQWTLPVQTSDAAAPSVAEAKTELPRITPNTDSEAVERDAFGWHATLPEHSSQAGNAQLAALEPAPGEPEALTEPNLAANDTASAAQSQVAAAAPSEAVSEVDQLPAELQPAARKLLSDSAQDRVTGLLELAEFGSMAAPAAEMIEDCLLDDDATVSTYAAVAYHRVTGDAELAAEHLAEQLASTNEENARLAAYLLGQMNPQDPQSIAALEALRDADRGVTSLHAAEALMKISPTDQVSFDALAQGLKSDDAEVRWFASVTLGTIEGEFRDKASHLLSEALVDSDENVRVAAALSLGGLGVTNEIALTSLQRAASEDSSSVRGAAATALACLRQ